MELVNALLATTALIAITQAFLVPLGITVLDGVTQSQSSALLEHSICILEQTTALNVRLAITAQLKVSSCLYHVHPVILAPKRA